MHRSFTRRLQLSWPTRRLRFAWAAEMVERFSNGTPLRLLDAGCSDGLFAERIALRHRDWSIVGVDADPDVLDAGREWLRRARVENATLRTADLARPLGREEYDAVVALEVLTEVPDDDAALRSIVLALRPGGLLLVHVPLQGWRPVTRLGRSEAWPGAVRRGYSSEELRTKLERAGFVRIRIAAGGRSMARLGTELTERIDWRPDALRLAWHPFALAMAACERHGLTWGPPTFLEIEAYRGVTD